MDWINISKLAGKHGIRYASNNSLEAFLREIGSHGQEEEMSGMARKYGFKEGPEGDEAEMVERSNGDWVRSNDYDDLAQEVLYLRRIISDVLIRLRAAENLG